MHSRPVLLAALTLACNPKPGSDDSGSASDSSDSAGTGSGASDTSSGQPTGTGTGTESGSSEATTTTTGAPTTGVTSTGLESGATDPPEACAEPASEDECAAAPGCQSVIGLSQQFRGCVEGPQFLACIDATPCDAVLTTVCRDGTDEVYQLTDGCVPPGFTACEGPGESCSVPVDCESIATAGECTVKQCGVVFGAPHITVDGQVCASYGADEQFLGCRDADAVCVDDVVILCPVGQQMPSWDSASGCVAPGFEVCDAPSVPPCP